MILEGISLFFTCMSIVVMVYGFFKTAKNMLTNSTEESFEENIKKNFDTFVLIGLQILIVADIIETIIAPDLQTISTVLIVVIIRTIMSWELNREKK